MPLSAGDRLGPYEILASIGKGGMGEVFRARDSRLNRDVAIKVSSETFSERFEREAKSIAQLNHPNICHLYDVGPNYLVMELVEGPDLKGPLSFDDALPIIHQLIDGIEAAHEKGIVHRDLKPANIKITPDGIVKILDFGLAKTTDLAPSSDPSNSPTQTIGGTVAGTILGTAAYMSPEQARGKQVDKRSDIWSFGVVVYELLTGQKLFSGESAVEILGSVLNKKPVLSAADPRAHNLLRWCLERDRKQRLASISDARHMLALGLPAVASPPSRDRKGTGWLWPAIAATSLIALITALALWAPWRNEPLKPLVRLEVDLGSEFALPPAAPGTLTFAPDGSRVVFVATKGNSKNRALYTRRLDQAQATALPGTEGGILPFFSPDSRWIGFYVNGKAHKISVEGGAVVPLADNPSAIGASWAEDDMILFGQSGSGMFRIPASGGERLKVTELAPGEISHSVPKVLPGGKAAIFASFGIPPEVDRAAIEVVTFADRKRKVIVRGATMPLYLPSGHLIYLNKSTLFAIAFDLDRLETRGAAVPILDDVKFGNQNASPLSFSSNGTFVYRSGVPSTAVQTLYTLQWVDPNGKRTPLLAKPAPYTAANLSPDGKRLVVVVSEGSTRNLHIFDPRLDTLGKLTFEGLAEAPRWTPDGRFVLFATAGGIFSTRADGSDQPQHLVEKSIAVPVSFTSNGDRLAYAVLGQGSGDIFTVSIKEEGGQLKAGSPEPFLKTAANEQEPMFSPDGRWIAYQTNESGRTEVNVRPFPPPANGQGGKWQISNNGGNQPFWSPTGKEIFYREGDRLMAVPYTVNGDSFSVQGKPGVHIEKLGGTQWDVSPDGRILVRIPETPASSANPAAPPAPDHTVVFLQNFFDELRRKVPIQ